MQTGKGIGDPYIVDTLISDVIADPVFGEYGRLTESEVKEWAAEF